MNLKRLIKSQYKRDLDFDEIGSDAKRLVDSTGFIPRSAEIKRMMAQGEMNILMAARENELLKGADPSTLPPVSVLNLKDLDKYEVTENIKARYNKFLDLQEQLKQQLLRSAPATPPNLERATVADEQAKADE